MSRLNLCLNCLESGAKGVPVGPDKGSQRDPYRESVQLCEICERFLLEGAFPELNARFKIARTVAREEAKS